MALPDLWDLDYDVVVAGYGFAGGMAAIAAHDAGARVAIFEKMPHFGGNSILSGGGWVVGSEYEPTLAYLKRTNGDTTDMPVLETFAESMVHLLPDLMPRLGREIGVEVLIKRWQKATYAFRGAEQMYVHHYMRPEEYRGFPWTTGVAAAGTTFWVLSQLVNRRAITQ